MSRFEIIETEHNPAPFSTVVRYYVRDNHSVVPSRRHWTSRPVSNYYIHLSEAEALSDWLAERDAGYPKRDLPWPRMDYCPACEGGSGPHVADTWHHCEAGYPKRDLPWHAIGCLHDGTPIPKPTIATRRG